MNITEREKEITITINIRYGVHMCTSIIHQIFCNPCTDEMGI